MRRSLSRSLNGSGIKGTAEIASPSSSSSEMKTKVRQRKAISRKVLQFANFALICIAAPPSSPVSAFAYHCHRYGFTPKTAFPSSRTQSSMLSTTRKVTDHLDSFLHNVETTSTAPIQTFQQTNLLIHWKGEDVEGYSKQLRHYEFRGALRAITGRICDDVFFTNALNYKHDLAKMSESKMASFNSAMQYIKFTINADKTVLNKNAFVKAAERCSLVHAIYQVVAEQDTFEDLVDAAIENGGFDDVMVGGGNENATWCLRVRHYGSDRIEEKAKRYGSSSRSMKLERKALNTLKPLLLKFGGKVDLLNPDCKIYIFDGLLDRKVLARRLATGPQTSVMDPNTRICVTNTPLCPIAAFVACNVAGVKDGCTILDPYGGSGATLLAAAMISPTCKSVAIEIAHDGLVNRDDIRSDFETRGLKPPLALLLGDSTDSNIRQKAREAIGNDPFDMIITDPPYGIRESKNYNAEPPLVELFQSIATDRDAGKPLVKIGGRLVAYVPCSDEEEIIECLPSEKQMLEAGLRLEDMREQPLNDKLSRWLVSYSCTR